MKTSESESASSADEEVPSGKVLLNDLEGNNIDLDKFKGKTVFLNFWATWCKPCIAEMPSIVRAQQTLNNEPVVFLLASDESEDKIKKFKTSHDFDLEFVRLITPVQDLDIMALPTTHIISPKGETVFSEMGGRTWDEEKNITLIRNISKQ